MNIGRKIKEIDEDPEIFIITFPQRRENEETQDDAIPILADPEKEYEIPCIQSPETKPG